MTPESNWRGLCEELLDEVLARPLILDRTLIDRALAALAHPEPEVVGPSDGEPPPGPFSEHDLRQQWNQQADEFNQWDSLDSSEQLAWAQVRAIAADRARWGRPAPVPAEGEVGDYADFVAWLVNEMPAGTVISDPLWWAPRIARRAADLLERQAAPVPVAVSERLPEPGVKVLAHYLNGLGKGRTICAIWVPAKSRSDDLDSSDDDFTEYDEETDKFYWPEGWYEAIENWDDLGWVKVYEGEVIYWQPLPQWPANALPLPSGEVEP